MYCYRRGDLVTFFNPRKRGDIYECRDIISFTNFITDGLPEKYGEDIIPIQNGLVKLTRDPSKTFLNQEYPEEIIATYIYIMITDHINIIDRDARGLETGNWAVPLKIRAKYRMWGLIDYGLYSKDCENFFNFNEKWSAEYLKIKKEIQDLLSLRMGNNVSTVCLKYVTLCELYQ